MFFRDKKRKPELVPMWEFVFCRPSDRANNQMVQPVTHSFGPDYFYKTVYEFNYFSADLQTDIFSHMD